MKKVWKKPLDIRTKRYCKRFASFHIGQAKHGGLSGESFNCECTDGVLRAGIGAEQVFDESNSYTKTSRGLPARCQFFVWPGVNALGERIERLGALDESGNVYSYFRLDNKWVVQYPFETKMRAVRVVFGNAEEKTVFIGEQGIFVFVYGEELQEMDLTDIGNKAHMACFAQGRLFFVQAPNVLRFSKAYEPTDFSLSVHDSGAITLPCAYGEVIDLLAFGDKVYVVYERGISVVEIRGSACDFTVRTIAHHGGRIFEGSVSAWGVEDPKLFFLTEQGVCRLQGERIERVCKNLPIYPKLRGQVCEHGAFEGKYMLTYYDLDNERRCVVVDVETGDGYFSFVPLGLSEYKGGCICHFGGKVYHLHRNGELPETEGYKYSVQGLRFGDDKVKRLETIEIEGDEQGEVEITIVSETQSKTVILHLGAGEKRVQVGLCGKAFHFYFYLSQGVTMYAMTAEFSQIVAMQ